MSPIKQVDLSKPVEFLGYKDIDNVKVPVDIESTFEMTPEQAQSFVNELEANNALSLIEETLQQIAVGFDGTEFLTAFPTVEEFEEATDGMENVPKKLTELMSDWKKLGAVEVVIDFVKAE